jgi:ADP-ribosyl-[dinitrogen reductase] hydrolase
MDERGRARGALLGQAVGDALGTTLEFTHPTGVPDFPKLAEGPLTDIVGGGPFRLEPGQVTDDTQMAVALAKSILKDGGEFNPNATAQDYAAWRSHAFDIGGQTSGAISEFRSGTDARYAGLASWDRGGRRAAGNGSLMRTSPIGVYYRNNRDARLVYSLIDSAITHADPRCMLACAAFNGAIAAGIRGESKDTMFFEAMSDLAEAAHLLRYSGHFKNFFSE